MPRPRVQIADVVALLPVVGVLLWQISVLHVGLDDLDEGYFAEHASRILRGEVPYRDFHLLYTPAIVYLHAFVYQLAGEHVIALRQSSLVARAITAFMLYVLGRRVASPAFAVMAPLSMLVGLDESPDQWRPLPGWYTAIFVTTGAFFFSRALESTRYRTRWLLAAGACVGLVFVFKQNTGAFIGAALAGFLLLSGRSLEDARTPVSPLLRAAQVTGLVAILLAVTWLVIDHLTPVIFAYLIVPIGCVGTLLMASAPTRAAGVSLWHRATPMLPLVAGFAVVTVLWLVPLLGVLGWDATYLRTLLFPTADIAAVYWPIELYSENTLAVVYLVVAALASVWAARFFWPLGIALFLVGTGLSFFAGLSLTIRPEQTLANAIPMVPFEASRGMAAALPGAAVLMGIWALRRPPETDRELRLRLYLALGVFAFLAQYPRLDVVHLAWASPLLLIVGAASLERIHSRISASWRLNQPLRVALFTVLALIPSFAALPMIYQRVGLFFYADEQTGQPIPTRFALLDLRHANGLWLRETTRDDLKGVTEYIQRYTSADEPVLVYPSSPMLYVLAERRSPIPFSHLYPGAATKQEIRDIIAHLEAINLRMVVFGDFWQSVWLNDSVYYGARTETPTDNVELDEYIERTYGEVARFGQYRVLWRRPTS